MAKERAALFQGQFAERERLAQSSARGREQARDHAALIAF